MQAPIAFHYLLTRVSEWLMTVPLVALAQVRILEEEVIEAARAPDQLPDDLMPSTPFDATSIQSRLPEPGPFGLRDLRAFDRRSHR